MLLHTRMLIVFSFLCSALPAQTFEASISGHVLDAAGRDAAGVAVSLEAIATGEMSRTLTNPDGRYVIGFLNPGTYRMTFQAKGFEEILVSGVELQVNQSIHVNETLTIGSMSDTVAVNASLSQLTFDSPEIGHVVGAQQMENVPNLANPTRGRSPFLLAKLLPGVTSTSPDNSNINNFSFGGGRPDTNEILIDGLPTTNPSDNTYTFTPSPDSVDEFKVITNPFSAEIGHTGGGVLMATSKHGSNDFHGSLYEYFRNRILNARSFFQAANNQRYIQNDPGFTFGGPLVVPHYNGRNKTFFFADYNVTLAARPKYDLQLTPTSAERGGDLSQTRALSAIYDPLTTTVDSKGNISRQPFAGNWIQASRIDPVSARILNYYPNPNGSFQGGAYNYQMNTTRYDQTWQGLIRIDRNFSDQDKLFVRYGRYHPNTDAVQYLDNAANSDNGSGWWDNQAGIGFTHIFSPSVYNELRVGFVQEKNYQTAGGGPVPSLGLKGVDLSAFPQIATTSYIPLGASSPSSDRDRSWVLDEALQVQQGKHLFKMGGDYRRQMYNYYNPGYNDGYSTAGYYKFDSTFTSISGNPKSGWDLADLLLGLPTSTTVEHEDYTYRENINSAGLYFQDDFKASSRLTLNLGVRWEFDGPYSEANNQFASFNPALKNKTTGNLGDLELAGLNGAPTHFMPNVYHDLLPRAGFAWNVWKNTLFRGGVGFFRLPDIGFYQYGPLSQYAQQATFQSLDGVAPAYQLSQGVPPVPYLEAAPASLSKPTSSVTEIDTRTRTPYNIAWQFGLQRQFGSWFAEVDYAASKGVKLPIVLQINQLLPGQFRTGTQAQRPFPQYANVQYLTLDGNSIYHSLQAKLEHHWRNGLVVQAAYTFSKLLDDVDEVADSTSRAHKLGVQNVYNLRAEWGVGGYDIPQRFVANYFYRLPFGRGQKFLSGTPLLRDVVAGWEISGVTQFQIGQPLAITQSNKTNGFTEAQRPNATGQPVFAGTQTLLHWFNTAAFQAAPAYTLGNAARFPLHGPGINNWDLALQRNFVLHEHVKLQLRGEFFNALNHAQFNNPNGNVQSAAFGVVSGSQAGRVTEVAVRLFF